MQRPTKEQVKAVIDEVDTLHLGDGAHWVLIHEKLGLPYGEVFDYIAADPKFFDECRRKILKSGFLVLAPITNRIMFF